MNVGITIFMLEIGIRLLQILYIPYYTTKILYNSHRKKKKVEIDTNQIWWSSRYILTHCVVIINILKRMAIKCQL